MANRSPARSDRIGEEADVTYNIATPFNIHDASIYLFDRDDEMVEVLIGMVPEPYMYHDNYDTDDRTELNQHAIAQWLVDEAAKPLERWDYQTSDYKTTNPNFHLRDIYFECTRSEVNEAVLVAKEVLHTIEEKVMHQRECVDQLPESPLQDLEAATN